MTTYDLRRLIERDIILSKLESGGVDNWQWYGESLGDEEDIEDLVQAEIQSLRIKSI